MSGVSWVLPVHNGAPWLQGCVRSVLADAVGDDELIVVDDGSTDGGCSHLPPDPRLSLVRTPHRGLVSALELGWRRASHPYIARIDADDEVVAGRRRAQVSLLEADNLDVVAGRGETLGVFGEGMSHHVAWVNSLRDLHAALLIESPLFHPAAMIRRSALEAVGGYRDGDFPEDYDLWLRLAEAGFRLGAVPDVVVRLRDHGGRLTRTDERYRRRAFVDLKLGWAERVLFPGFDNIAIWGAGRTGRPWIRAVANAGRLRQIVDIAPRGPRYGVAVVQPRDFGSVPIDLLLVAVGARGARQEIRRFVLGVRPDLVEGVNWFAVA